MNKITYEERKQVYDADAAWQAGSGTQDATIMLEQMRQMLNINDSVCSWMDYKIAALKRKVEK